MTTEDLESLLEGATETPALDIKAACGWDVASMAKDILAMSNLQDGGYIVIGVENATFVRQGITADQRDSFDLDKMKDQMAPFADPHVHFTTAFPKDAQGKEYAVIRVFPFEEIPVICRKDSRDTHAGVIYYRNKNRRVQSAAVSNSYDMRDIVTMATVRMMQRRTAVGFTVQDSVASQLKKKLDDELEDL